MADWGHECAYLQGPDVGFMHHDGDDDEVPLIVSACSALGNRAAVCMCMAAGDSCGPKICTKGGDVSCF